MQKLTQSIEYAALGAGILICLLGQTVAVAQPFTYEGLIERARQLAGQAFDDNRGHVPDALKDLSYEQYQSINYNADEALWKGDGLFTVQFFHPGFYFERPVTVNVVENGESTKIPFRPDMFVYRKFDPAGIDLENLGFAGFRIHYPLHTTAYHDEVAVFLGASYFRLVGRNQQYGISARGLAIDTALGHGEEFPVFTEFWIEKPAPEATSVVVYALLDSVSVSGAYRFVIRPRTETQVEVKATLFPRREIAKLGLAPLTSMFLYGENKTHYHNDFRPEVHDSDGLLLHTGSGEWLWRPLVNRRALNISQFFDTGPQGFGLVQRDRNFAHYQDLGANYQRRPSIWIQPLGNWGPGHVELVEIPSDSEINDNIVGYWVPENPVEAGQTIELTYLISAFLEHDTWPPGGRVEATRIGTAARPGATKEVPPEGRLFVVDFNGGDLPYLDQGQPVEGVVTVTSGRVENTVVQRNAETGGWRVFFDFIPDGGEAVDLRCFLRLRDHVLTETWNYLWVPASQ